VKLNLGCGQNRLAGYVNVDREASVAPDAVMDLERFPWPFETDSVEEVQAVHVLEHVGARPEVFIGIMQELYRVCRGGATIHIAVPHPRHDNFFDDPTHVRAITPMTLSLFSRENCAKWQAAGGSNSPLAVYADVDFRLTAWSETVDPRFKDHPNLEEMLRHWNNIATEYRMVLEVVK
jgi:SAM-dependent methyltransferase